MSTTEKPGDGAALAERVYRDLLRMIIDGDLRPDTWLKERDLSERFEVSRVPVRQALQRLEAEGFVAASRNRGAKVTSVSRADVEELFDARLCIEPYATRAAAFRVHAGLASIDRLEELLEGAIVPGGSEQVGESRLGFHHEIVNLSGNRLLMRSMTPMLGRMEWIFRLTPSTREREQALEHRELLEAIRAGRGEVAAAQAYAHIDQAREPILDALAGALGW